MSNVADTLPYLSSLRERAVEQLTHQSRADLVGSGISQAMAVLFRLASSPATADDALALLHELQVHQVELEMQHEELRHSRLELERALVRQTALFERAPAAYLVIDEHTEIREINRAAARLLGAPHRDLLDRPLGRLLSTLGAEQLGEALRRARNGSAPRTFELQLLPQAGVARTLHGSADKDSSPGCYLLVLLAPPVPGCARADPGSPDPSYRG